MTEITQADQDAAVEWYSPRESEWTGLLAEAFARHREQAEAETVAKIVTWLRGGAGIGASLAHPSVLQAIETGEWKQ